VKFLYNFINIISVPLWFFNSFAGIVGAVWLLVQGHWNLVFFGVIALFLSKIYFSLSFAPYFGLMKLGVSFYEKENKFLAWPIFYIANFLNMGVVSIWVFVMFLNGASFVDTPIGSLSLTPMYLWCYGLATWPIQYMASKDPIEATGTNLSVSFTTFGAIWVFFAVVVLGIDFYSAFWGFLFSMFICLNLMFYNALEQERMR